MRSYTLLLLLLLARPHSASGQSNMEGHAKIETMDYLGDDPATVPLLNRMRDDDGRPRVCERVWISYLTGNGDVQGEGTGRLTAGYGARQNPQEDGGKIGPEFNFGLMLEDALNEPVLLIKTAWGGNSLLGAGSRCIRTFVLRVRARMC